LFDILPPFSSEKVLEKSGIFFCLCDVFVAAETHAADAGYDAGGNGTEGGCRVRFAEGSDRRTWFSAGDETAAAASRSAKTFIRTSVS